MKSKKIIGLVLSICLLGTMGFAAIDTGKPMRNISSWVGLINGVRGSAAIKEMPVTISENKAEKNIKIQVGEEVFTGTLEDNPTAKALADKLPLTLSMGDLNSNEKYYFMKDKLPTNSERVGSIKSGDIMLYGSDCLVLFYEGFNTSYSYTKLGSIDDTAKLKTALGKGDVKVTWSLEK